MNLLSRKSQLALARDGVQLLRHKREVLMTQFMELVRPLMEKQQEIYREMVNAFNCLNTARSIDGCGAIEVATLLREYEVTVEVRRIHKRGLEMAIIDSVDGIGAEFREPHAHGTSLRIFETRDRFERTLAHLLELAPLEASIRRLGREIQKTTRRINALEEMLMPRLSGK